MLTYLHALKIWDPGQSIAHRVVECAGESRKPASLRYCMLLAYTRRNVCVRVWSGISVPTLCSALNSLENHSGQELMICTVLALQDITILEVLSGLRPLTVCNGLSRCLGETPQGDIKSVDYATGIGIR